MGRWLPAFDYPSPKPGYWEPVTSTINWCEEDYYATSYSAEIVNTLTNAMFLYLGVKGVRNCIKYKHDRVFIVSFLGYLLVGTGSFAFHATLKYPMQLVDELSMIYTTCIMCYACFSHAKTRFYSDLLALGLAGLAAFITIYYHYLQDPTFHQNAYAILTAVVLIRSMYLMEVNLRPSLREKWGTIPTEGKDMEEVQRARKQNAVRDAKILKSMWLMIGTGLSVFLGGFALWNVDNEFCSTLRIWRRQIGLPWGIFLEGHGWWHLMTGVGAYFYLVWGVWLRHVLNERQHEYGVRWPSMLWTLPEIVPVHLADDPEIYNRSGVNGSIKSESNGSANGHSIKHANGHANGHTNGHANGNENGYANGSTRKRLV